MSDRYSDTDEVAWPSEEEDKESSYNTYLDRETSYDYLAKKVFKIHIDLNDNYRITLLFTQ